MRPDSSRESPRQIEAISPSSSSSAGLAESLVGRPCRVQFRGDALGLASDNPLALTGRWAEGSSLHGTVVEMTDQWLVLRTPQNKRVVIPQARILLIELSD